MAVLGVVITRKVTTWGTFLFWRKMETFLLWSDNFHLFRLTCNRSCGKLTPVRPRSSPRFSPLT